ncbi:uncharacterized protein EDB91DRAFT_1081512 [Suillus paluster]|uniref:uncharacterized protein n=1 Tax=Suillus paluster TaxID=48578 RepID=UPI001B876AE4|nr:uncharacterized protein EDB91DRAFT_1081512 [Suillus paluster]KAG1742346.1 hypothetical protein EDB91DRAFT_1081512 [Suillus paluster]
MQILEACQQKNQIACANPKATSSHDVNATFASMDHEWMALCACMGIEGFYVAVQGFFTQKAEKFVKDILNLEPHHLGLKLESFVVSGLDSIALENNIKSSIKMNYTNYKQNIVEHCSFALISWPLAGPVQSPSKVGGRSGVENLLRALHEGSCHWVKLTDQELSA